MAALRDPRFIDQIRQAEIVIGRDEKTGNEFLLFGRSTARAVIASGKSMRVMAMLVPILQHTTELEALSAAVRIAKGYDEYEAAPADA
jgi:hypothetical protein